MNKHSKILFSFNTFFYINNISFRSLPFLLLANNRLVKYGKYKHSSSVKIWNNEAKCYWKDLLFSKLARNNKIWNVIFIKVRLKNKYVWYCFVYLLFSTVKVFIYLCVLILYTQAIADSILYFISVLIFMTASVHPKQPMLFIKIQI